MEETPQVDPAISSAEEQRERKAATMRLNMETAKRNSALQEKVLQLWIERGNEFVNAKVFAEVLGPENGFDYEWLSKRKLHNRAFNNRWKAVRSDGKTNKKIEVTDRTRVLAEKRWAHLSEPWMGLWLEKYRETKKRRLACEAVNKTLREVEYVIESNPDFAKGYGEVFDEFRADMDDAAVAQAAEGKGGAMASAALETQSERFSKAKMRSSMKQTDNEGFSMDDYDVSSTRSRAKELFQRLLEPVSA